MRHSLILAFFASMPILPALPAAAGEVTFKTDEQKISGALWCSITMCNYAYKVQNSSDKVLAGELSEQDLAAELREKLGLTKVTVLRRSKYNTLAIVASNKNVVVVAFRGTENDNDKNSDMNKDGLLIPSWKYVAYKGVHVAPPMIHHGWLKCMDDWYGDLRDELKDKHDSYNKAIFITGHSLGGALAPLFAQRFIGEKGGMRTSLGVHVLTFGAPVVGNQRFVDMYHDNRTKYTKYQIDHYAYYDKEDSVATRRPSGYRVHGKWRTIDKPKTFTLWNEDGAKRTAEVSWWDDAHDRNNYELAMKLRLIADLPDAYEAGKTAPAKIGHGEKYVHIKNLAWPTYLNPKN